MTLPVGLHLNIPAAVYHADPCERPALSSSIAKILLEQSAEHAYAAHPRLGGGRAAVDEDEDDKETGPMRMGSLVHHLLLGGGSQYVRVLTRDAKTGEMDEAQDYRTKSAQEHRDMILEQGKVPVLGKKYDTAEKFCAKLRPKLAIPEQTEVTAIWESGGVLCKGRLDGLHVDGNRASIYDLKSTSAGNALRASTVASMVGYGYHIQRAAYVEAVRTRVPKVHTVEFEFAFAEVGGVCGVVRRDLPPEAITLGELLWKRAKKNWAVFTKHDAWPGYPEDKRVDECPPWILAQLETELLHG